jgi:hypothetical protein
MCPSFLRNEDIVEMGIDEEVDVKEMVKQARMVHLDFYSCLTTPPALILRAFRLAPTIKERVISNHKSTALSVDYTAPATGKGSVGQRIS